MFLKYYGTKIIKKPCIKCKTSSPYSAFVRTKLKDVMNGGVIERTFNPSKDVLKKAFIERPFFNL